MIQKNRTARPELAQALFYQTLAELRTLVKIHVVRYKLGYIRFYNLLRCHRLYTMKWKTKRANSTLRTPASTPTTEKMKSQTSGVPFLLKLS